MKVQATLTEVGNALKTKPVTLAYKPDIVVKARPDDNAQPLEPVTAGGRHRVHRPECLRLCPSSPGGSGYRVIMGKWFIMDRAPFEDAQTVYHELTHKVVRTKTGATGCRTAKTCADQPRQAIDNADSVAYFVVSFLK